jgi:hypothetical protein
MPSNRQHTAPINNDRNGVKRPLLTDPSGQPKTEKGEALNVSTAVLHLAPHTLGGRGNVCASASTECIEACLNRTGRGGILAGSLDDIRAERTNPIQLARIARTRRFFDDGADVFVADLAGEIQRHVARARRRGMVPAIRLNGTSDLPWERIAPDLFARFSDVQFYDYTKHDVRKRPASALPSNYHLTMSYSGHNAAACLEALDQGRNVAVVFLVKRGKPLPMSYMGRPVIDGDVNDLRFMDPAGVIVGLRLKGNWSASNPPRSAFIVDPAEI